MSRFGCYFPGVRKKWLRLVIKGSGLQARIIATPCLLVTDRLTDPPSDSLTALFHGILNDWVTDQ